MQSGMQDSPNSQLLSPQTTPCCLDAEVVLCCEAVSVHTLCSAIMMHARGPAVSTWKTFETAEELPFSFTAKTLRVNDPSPGRALMIWEKVPVSSNVRS